MVAESPVHDFKLSSVVPARATGEDTVRELTNTDLAMKLHYIKGLYFFNSDAVRGIDIFALKKPMFDLLDLHYAASGRIRRRLEDGRPFIKCNDSGVRTVEARCSRTVDEWLALKNRTVDDDRLVYSEPLGLDLGFSPLVFVQFTWFKCGGLSVGLSWAHILGDAFSASAFINMWGQIMAGQVPPQPLNMPNTRKISQFAHSISQQPFSLERVDPVGDSWTIPNPCEMKSHSFHVTTKKLDHIISSTSGLNLAPKHHYFQILAALMWKSLAKIRGESSSGVVTICTNNSRKGNESASNSQVIGSVEADFNVGKSDLSVLAKLIDEKMIDERSVIEEFMERESGQLDFVIYGANLTFVNLEEEEIYGLQIQGKGPVFANYTLGGVGKKGVVLVLPRPDGKGGSGRTVTVIVPENQIVELKNELRKEWGIV